MTASGPVRTVVAVDLGGTGIKAARLDLHGRVVARRTVATPVAAGAGAVVNAVGEVARSLVVPGTVGVGLCAPGVLDTAAGLVRYAPNLGMRDVALAAAVQQHVGAPVVMEHDVRAACLAEHRMGLGRGVDDLVVIALGTGVAAGVVTGGRLVTGAAGAAGELGHVPVHVGGEPCPCGQRGCLEAYASAGGIVRRHRAAGGAAGRTAADIAASAFHEPVAARIWQEGAEALARALVTITMILDPSVIALTGGLTGAGEHLLGPVRTALAAGLAWREPPRVAISALGAEASLYGAALHFLETAGLHAVPTSWQAPTGDRGAVPSQEDGGC
ncbi:ROK family protein [Modestobacter sp. VKM Ac-2977]|uniref:ROK family protein n=1 Tax=Modestobacter sp. VKM Ac-2977 TaxID=3004131 RepID=UPI0022AAC423|nr:ROK family protein [Modestobacter sp. VKM Ac-2977]MCZ2822647.1 ROK family protein [Modestobacter sp. VKM Ac-2977]